ncbi:MAG TPA: ribonuclease HI [Opitutaceae bacterium]|nr:ribonuclease HI [Opitutaceae bacterium]
MPDPDIIFYTDGACETNPGPGGWAAILTSGKHRKEISGGARHTTNNRMELRAVIEALQTLKKPGSTVKVVTDSQYVAAAVTERWIEKWAAKGFRKGDGFRENADLWIELRGLLARHDVTFEWIRGHAGHPENEACDVMAVAARRQKELAPDEGFENPEKARVALGLSLL